MTQLEKAKELKYKCNNYILLKRINGYILIIGELQEGRIVDYYIDCDLNKLRPKQIDELKRASDVMERDFKEILKYD